MRLYLNTLTFFMLLALPTAALAEDNSYYDHQWFYAGVGYAFFKHDDSEADTFVFTVGSQFNQYFGAELNYATGEWDATSDGINRLVPNSGASASADLNAVEFAFTGRYPFYIGRRGFEEIAPYISVGYTQYKYSGGSFTYRARVYSVGEADEQDISAGAGIEIKFHRNFGLRGGYKRLDEYDVFYVGPIVRF